jgi:uncharacterized protein involved in exopolysaccharide biosynthesis
MQELNLALIDQNPKLPAPPTARDWAAAGFRHGRLMLFTFLAIFGGVVLVTWLMPQQYEAQTKILVKHERQDPVVTTSSNAQQTVTPDTSEMELNSEVELLKSRDLLEKVVTTNGLQKRAAPSWLRSTVEKFGDPKTPSYSSDETSVLRAVRGLEQSLTVEPLKKTKLIRVSYRSPDPKFSAAVLQTLVRFYLEKHLEVHRTPGVADFFQTQADEYHKGLMDAEQRLAAFGNKDGAVAPPLERDLALNKVNDFEAQLRQARASISETEGRIRILEEQQTKTPERHVTAVKITGNQLLEQELEKKLIELELQRTQLLSKYTPEYRPVQEVEAEIGKTKEAIARMASNPTREEITDRDSTHDWLTNELAKARADLVAYQARVSAIAPIIDSYKSQARQLHQTEFTQQDLTRAAKTAEENFLLYSRKQEEARISEALDKQRIVNVSIAEEATPPAFPSSPNWLLNLGLGLMFALFASVAIAFTADYFDRSFRTPEEVELVLSVPVLAYLPKN